MNTRRLTSLGTLGLMLAAIGCGGSGGGGTGGTSGNAGNTGKAGANGAAGSGAAGSGAAGATGTAGTQGGGGAAGSGAAGASGGAGASGNAGATGSAGSGGVGGAFGPSTLLVDDNVSDNNDPTNTSPVASTSDTMFASLLAGEAISYTTYHVPIVTFSGPTYTQLTNVSTIIWYTGDAFGSTLTPTQETTLENWLDLGGKTLLIFSEDLIYDFDLSWAGPNTDTFATTYMGLTGGDGDASVAAGGTLVDTTYTVTGNTAVPAFSGLSFVIDKDAPNNTFNTTADAVNPATGSDVLLTTPADPTASGADTATPVASGHTKGTSKIVYIGVPLESIHGAPSNTSTQLFHAVLKYAGLKTN